MQIVYHHLKLCKQESIDQMLVVIDESFPRIAKIVPESKKKVVLDSCMFYMCLECVGVYKYMHMWVCLNSSMYLYVYLSKIMY